MTEASPNMASPSVDEVASKLSSSKIMIHLRALESFLRLYFSAKTRTVAGTGFSQSNEVHAVAVLATNEYWKLGVSGTAYQFPNSVMRGKIRVALAAPPRAAPLTSPPPSA